MSMVVLTIGYQQFLLPDDKGLATAVKALTRGRPCRYSAHRRSVEVIGDDDGAYEAAVEISYLPRGTEVVSALRAARARAPKPRLLGHEGGS